MSVRGASKMLFEQNLVSRVRVDAATLGECDDEAFVVPEDDA